MLSTLSLYKGRLNKITKFYQYYCLILMNIQSLFSLLEIDPQWPLDNVSGDYSISFFLLPSEIHQYLLGFDRVQAERALSTSVFESIHKVPVVLFLTAPDTSYRCCTIRVVLHVADWNMLKQPWKPWLTGEGLKCWPCGATDGSYNQQRHHRPPGKHRDCNCLHQQVHGRHHHNHVNHCLC